MMSLYCKSTSSSTFHTRRRTKILTLKPYEPKVSLHNHNVLCPKHPASRSMCQNRRDAKRMDETRHDLNLDMVETMFLPCDSISRTTHRHLNPSILRNGHHSVHDLEPPHIGDICFLVETPLANTLFYSIPKN